MEITIKLDEDRSEMNARKVAISGAMTIYDAAAGKETLLDALNDAADLEIDLSEVTEMDTAGAQLLVLLKREAASAGKRVVLSGRSPEVLEVFDRYRIAGFFEDAVAIREERQ